MPSVPQAGPSRSHDEPTDDGHDADGGSDAAGSPAPLVKINAGKMANRLPICRHTPCLSACEFPPTASACCISHRLHDVSLFLTLSLSLSLSRTHLTTAFFNYPSPPPHPVEQHHHGWKVHDLALPEKGQLQLVKLISFAARALPYPRPPHLSTTAGI